MNKIHTAFICVISNILGTESEKSLVNKIEANFGPIKTIFPESSWLPPSEYILEMGNNLSTKIYILKKKMNENNLESLKNICMSLEEETSISSRKRIFNLNPGYLSSEGMFLLTHKPNEQRKRSKLNRFWVEQQYDVVDDKYVLNNNTFSEYKGDRLDLFNSL